MSLFYVFAGDDYYPAGGASDWNLVCETLEMAQSFLNEKADWMHIAEKIDGELKITWRKAWATASDPNIGEMYRGGRYTPGKPFWEKVKS